jgi:hypothetical protein
MQGLDIPTVNVALAGAQLHRRVRSTAFVYDDGPTHALAGAVGLGQTRPVVSFRPSGQLIKTECLRSPRLPTAVTADPAIRTAT